MSCNTVTNTEGAIASAPPFGWTFLPAPVLRNDIPSSSRPKIQVDYLQHQILILYNICDKLRQGCQEQESQAGMHSRWDYKDHMMSDLRKEGKSKKVLCNSKYNPHIAIYSSSKPKPVANYLRHKVPDHIRYEMNPSNAA